MHNSFKYLLGGLAATIIFLLFLSFKTGKPQEPVISSINEATHIPEEISIFDTTVSLSRYDMRERFDRELLGFVYFHSQTIATIKRANNYFPLIEPILKKNGIPNDFKYLALIESFFQIRSISSAKAAGLWQLMPETAKELGLEVNDEVDERYHIEKSTEAACLYFIRAYKKFGDWMIVAASYNAGMSRLSTNIEQQQVNNAFDLLLPNETSRYIFRILAAKELLKNPKKYGFVLKKEDMYHVVKCQEIRVDSSINNLSDFAKSYGITYSQLKDYNVWLRNNQLTNSKKKPYIISIPDKNDMNFHPDKVVIYQKNWVAE